MKHYECASCCKEDVCKYKNIYMSEIEAVMKFIDESDVLDVNIKCSKSLDYPIELGSVNK